MNVADWVILAVIAISVVQAAVDGFFRQAIGLAGLVFGYLLAAWQYQQVAAWIEPYFKSAWAANIAGFLLIFAGVLILSALLGSFARWVVKETGLTFFDRVLGGLLGLVRGALVVAIVLVAMTAFSPTSKRLEGSQLAPYFQVIGRAAIWVAPASLRAQFYHGLEMLRQQRSVGDASKAGSTSQ